MLRRNLCSNINIIPYMLISMELESFKMGVILDKKYMPPFTLMVFMPWIPFSFSFFSRVIYARIYFL